MVRDFLAKLKKSNKTAIVCGQKTLSYKQWHCLSGKLSKEILKNACGELVGLFLPNGITYAVSYFGILYADKVVVPFYSGSTEDEVIYTIKSCGISTLITTDEYYSYIENIIRLNKMSMIIIVMNNEFEVKRKNFYYMDNAPLSVNEESELKDVVVLLHTSGTTSKPKRVMLTNQGLLSNIRSHCESLDFDDKEICLIQLPMMFGYCNTAQFLAHVYLGACIIINANPFLVADFYKLIEKWKVTNFTAVPSILNIIYDSDVLAYDISSLKIICFGGGPISKKQLLNIIKKFPSIAFVQTYGLTEAGPRVTTLSPTYCIDKVGSVGQAIPGVEIRIIDAAGNNLSTGELGEVVVKSQGIMKGYFNCKEESLKIIQGDWLFTGDLGYLSEDGFLYIVGRKKNVIITGGLNVCPEEVEKTILSYSGIKETKVYGVNDDLLGEKIFADIIVDADIFNGIQRLKEHCLNKLSGYKVPKKFCIVNNIYRTYNGKIKRATEKGKI